MLRNWSTCNIYSCFHHCSPHVRFSGIGYLSTVCNMCPSYHDWSHAVPRDQLHSPYEMIDVARCQVNDGVMASVVALISSALYEWSSALYEWSISGTCYMAVLVRTFYRINVVIKSRDSVTICLECSAKAVALDIVFIVTDWFLCWKRHALLFIREYQNQHSRTYKGK